MTPNQKRLAALTVAGSSLFALITNFEGTKTVVYEDVVNVNTVCTGHTEPGLVVGQVWTKEKCDATLATDTQSHGERLLSCIAVDLSTEELSAYTSWAFNVGTGAACKSTVVKLLNQGRRTDACNGLMVWNRAGGRVVRGLTNRRRAERDLCLKGV